MVSWVDETGVNWPARMNQALAQLADGCTEPDEVAAKLEAGGFKGEVENCWVCPVANYLTDALKDVMPNGWHVSTDSTSASLFDGGLEVYLADMPEVAGKFIVCFDDDEYPALGSIDDTPECPIHAPQQWVASCPDCVRSGVRP